jgi:flagellar hook-basal body complex protein FliE
MPMPIDPSFAVSGGEWQIPGLGQEGAVGGAQDSAPKGGGFGGMLANSIGALEKTQTEAAGASQAFAAGTVSDPTQVVMAVERAKLSMQMASTMRSKAVEAYQDIFHTQV